MGVIEPFRIIEWMILCYALSIILYFYDFIQQDRKARQLAFWLLLVVWTIQTIFLFTKIVQLNTLPVFNIADGLYFFVWLIMLVSIIIRYFYNNESLVFLINLIGFILMVIYMILYSTEQTEINEIIKGDLLLSHILIAFIAYTLYTLSFAFSVLYLLQFYMLKNKKWILRNKRFGSLEQLEKLSTVLIVFSTAILIISLILGVAWSYLTLNEFYWYDSKTIGTFLLIVIYCFILINKKIVLKKLAYWNLFAYLFLVINFIFTSQLSNYHFI